MEEEGKGGERERKGRRKRTGRKWERSRRKRNVRRNQRIWNGEKKEMRENCLLDPLFHQTILLSLRLSLPSLPHLSPLPFISVLLFTSDYPLRLYLLLQSFLSPSFSVFPSSLLPYKTILFSLPSTSYLHPSSFLPHQTILPTLCPVYRHNTPFASTVPPSSLLPLLPFNPLPLTKHQTILLPFLPSGYRLNPPPFPHLCLLLLLSSLRLCPKPPSFPPLPPSLPHLSLSSHSSSSVISI